MTDEIKRFFLMCSGANQEILARPECAIEHSKYAGIGATVFFTAALALISSSYALYSVFDSVTVALVFGSLWALIIFNLDRYIVSTMKKEYLPSHMPPKERRRAKWAEIRRALPRVLLAVFISIIITRPLELKLFESEITAQVKKTNSAEVARIKGLVKDEFKEIDDLKNENQQLRKELADRETQERELHDLAMDEALGKSLVKTTGKFGKGPVFEERMAAYNRFASESNALRAKNEGKIAKNQERIDALAASQDYRVRDTTEAQLQDERLLARLRGLSELASANKTVNWASWFLIILFMMLETAPILAKLFSSRGPYDNIYDAMEHSVFARERKINSQLNDDINTEVTLSKELNANKLAAELQLSASTVGSLQTIVNDEIQQAQKEIGKLLVEEWKQRELEKLRFRIYHTPATGNHGAVPPGNNGEPKVTPTPEFAGFGL